MPTADEAMEKAEYVEERVGDALDDIRMDVRGHQ